MFKQESFVVKSQITLKRIIVACSAALAVGCGKPGGSADFGSGGQTAGSNQPAATGDTVKAIQDRIAADAEMKGAEMKGADIKVKESEGSIALEGTVTSPAQKDKAEQIVYAVENDMKQQPGVKDYLMVKEGRSGTKGNGGN